MGYKEKKNAYKKSCTLQQETFSKIIIYHLFDTRKMLIKEAFVFIVLFFCTTANTLSTHYNQATKDGSVFTSTNVESTSKVIQEPLTSGLDSNDVIQRYLASVLQKRATVNQQTFAVGPKLSTDIVAQIKARIHTQITSKMSASVSHFFFLMLQVLQAGNNKTPNRYFKTLKRI